MNKHEYKSKVDELEFSLKEKSKELTHIEGEFGRLKAAYEMSNKQIKELQIINGDLRGEIKHLSAKLKVLRELLTKEREQRNRAMSNHLK